MDSEIYIGLMSGTSLDSIDAVLVDFTDQTPNLLQTHSHEITPSLKSQIQQLSKPDWKGSLSAVGELNQQLGNLFAIAAKRVIELARIKNSIIKAIGSHGQTLWHHPDGNHPFSMQLGNASIIAEITGITTVADFRSRDIAAGGQGAPLVPAFHQQMFSHPKKNRVILNIGGIANITVLPASTSDSKVFGYDTGPGNGLMDAWIMFHHQRPYDENGEWAASGKIVSELLEQLLATPYFVRRPPKSTGKELFNLAWLNSHLEKFDPMLAAEDVQATLAELTAISIAQEIDATDKLYVFGGGIHNSMLMNRIAQHKPDIKIESTASAGIEPDWMEAMAFAWLAKQTLEGKPGNLAGVTGAAGPRILGAIHPA